MGIGPRLKLAMQRRGITQRQVAEGARMHPGAVNKILSEKRKPTFEIVERIVAAIGVTWGELFNEPHILLPAEDAVILSRGIAVFRDFLPVVVRLVENHAAQKEIAAAAIEPPPPRRRRRKAAEEGLPRRSEIRDGAPIHHEVQPVANGLVPEWAMRLGATRPYTVHTDAMIGAGILEKALIYVRPTVDTGAADGQIIVCTLNKSTYLKRLDLRGGRKVLENANPRYAEITVTDDDDFAMLGVVVGF